LRASIIVIATAVLCAGCTEDTPTSAPAQDLPPNPLDQTPRENYEAEFVALSLSGELVAPQALYEEVRDGLAHLRSQYSDSIPDGVGFRAICWLPGEITGSLTEEASVEIRNGSYTEMDSLNAMLRLARMDTTSFSFSREQVYFHLFFEGRLHADRLREIYDLLPSVEYTSHGYLCLDQSQYYPRLIDGGVSYLFRRGFGDCPSGCIYSEFWYFKVIDLNVEYVGHWDPQSEPEPSWWNEAKMAFCADRGGGTYCRN
jgi:hypothetical protein